MSQDLKLDFAAAFGGTTTDKAVSKSASISGLGPAADAPLADIRERLVASTESPEGLQHWQTYRRTSTAASTIGKGALVERITAGKISSADGPALFRFARAEALLRAIFRQYPELETFDGGKFEELIEEFCNLDIRRLELPRTEVADAHWQGIGRQWIRQKRVSDAIASSKCCNVN